MSRSNAFCSSLLHLLVLFSLAVCSISEARPIAGLQEEPAAPGKPKISSKDEEKSGVFHARVSVSSSAKPSNQIEPEVVGKMYGTQPLEHKLKDGRRSDALQVESVSWKLSRPKAPNTDERQPGSFNQLDYDPPRTHPPSHN